ncbi:MAG: 2-oxo acid dehydrogenase subunit E2 [Planctomycetota bacterium]
MTPHALSKTLFLAPLAAVLLGSFATAQITSATRLIGGPGGLTSCGAFNPPTLCDGITQASASVQFTYDAGTTTLTLAVNNTSPVTTGVVNPVMTSLYFNVPVGAVNAIALTGQSAAGATQPAWTMTWDSDLQALPNPNFVFPFGRFNACLFGNPSNGIANPAADTLAVPPGSEILGPVTFTFQVTPSTGATLNAGTFANAFSITTAAGKNVNTAAHFTYVEEIDMTELVALRARAKVRAAERGAKLTFLPFICKAVVSGLKKWPMLNASLDESTQEIVRKKYYHLGIAAQGPQGLAVSVVRDADRRSIFDLAREIDRLGDAVRAGTATRDELTGSTFTISSLGKLGGVLATPIINFPEVAILGVHKIDEKPAVRGGQIVIRHLMNLSISVDHRLADGWDGAMFLQDVKTLLEDPTTMFMELV